MRNLIQLCFSTSSLHIQFLKTPNIYFKALKKLLSLIKNTFHYVFSEKYCYCLSIICIVFSNVRVFSQTTLAAGDMAIIGYNYDASPQTMAIVALTDIASGTVIRITDYGYDENTGTFGTTSTISSSEGCITWTTTSAIASGTVITFTITSGATPSVSGLPGSVSITGWTNSVNTTSPSPAGGDNWFIFQGSSPTSVSTFIFGWMNTFATTFNAINQPAGQFLVSGSGASPNVFNSYLPPSLTLGTNAIAINRDVNSGGYHGDDNVYSGIKSDSKASLLAAICSPSNWLTNEITAYDLSVGGTYFSGANPVFSVISPNSAPTDISLSTTFANENIFGGSTIASISTTDPDAGNSFTYSLVAGTGSTDNASFNISGSSLRISNSPDYETKSSYSIRIRTTDQGGLTYEEPFTIIINDINEAPTNISLSASAINENVASNSIIGTISTTDPDAGNSFTYSLVAGTGSTDNASFNISGSSLRISNSPDYETKSSYSIRIRTTDQGGLTYEEPFTITINDINEAPTNISLSASAIDENVASNSIIGTISTTDSDAGNSFTYSLVAGTGSTDNASFNISGSSLRIANSPDYETKSSYSIRIRTTDQGGLMYEKSSTITINDLSDGGPLPIELMDFNAHLNIKNQVELKWRTATEINNDYFTIERSADGVNFELVNIVKSNINNSQSVSAYSSIDESPLMGTSYYKLKQTDFNGAFSYSKVVSITNLEKNTMDFKIYPNPVKAGTMVTIEANYTINDNDFINLIDMTGKKMVVKKVPNNSDKKIEIHLSEQLTKGIYYVVFSSNNQTITQKLFVD